MAGIFALGDILDAALGRKMTQVNYSNDLKSALEAAIPKANNNYDANQIDIGEFSRALATARAKGQSMQAGDIGLLDLATNRLAKTGGVDTYKDLANFNYDLVGRAAKDVAGIGSGAQNLMLSRLGYGGRGPSTYTTATLLDRVSQNLAPLYSGALSGANAATNTAMSNDRANASSLIDTIAEKAGIPYRDAQTYLLPGQARNQDLAALIASLNGVGSGIKSNTAGFKEEKNKWAGVGQAIDGSLNSALDMALSAYTGGMAGGGGGGGPAITGGSGSGGGGGILSGLMGLFSKGNAKPAQSTGIDWNTVLASLATA